MNLCDNCIKINIKELPTTKPAFWGTFIFGINPTMFWRSIHNAISATVSRKFGLAL